MQSQLVDSTAFSVIYPVTLIIFSLTGYWIGYHFCVKRNYVWESSGIENGIVGFFALLISFSLLSSGNMMRVRTNLIHDQSDAIAQLSRDAKFLPDEEHQLVNQFLIEHINYELDFLKNHSYSGDSLMSLVAHHDNLFLNQLELLDSSDHHEEAKYIMDSFGNLNSTFYRTIYSFSERTPGIIIVLLIISSWLISILVGFMNSFHKRFRMLVPVIYIFLASFTMQAIRDLDNPSGGTITPNYENLVNLKAFIEEDR